MELFSVKFWWQCCGYLIFSKHLLDKGGSTGVTVSAYHFIDSDLNVRPPRAPSGDLNQMGLKKWWSTFSGFVDNSVSFRHLGVDHQCSLRYAWNGSSCWFLSLIPSVWFSSLSNRWRRKNGLLRITLLGRIRLDGGPAGNRLGVHVPARLSFHP